MASTSYIQYSEELDDSDRALIEALHEDGRMPFAQIAKRLGISPGTIKLRYDRLVDMGFLRVAAITNPLRMGYTTLALIGVRTDGARMLAVAGEIAAFEEVIYLIVVSGRFDIVFEVVCRDHTDLLRFLSEKLYKVEGVRESESFVHLKIEKEIYF